MLIWSSAFNYYILNINYFRGQDWGGSSSKNCYKETEPVSGSTYPAGSLPEQATVKSVLSNISKPVYLLDITLLSQLRKDAHPSAYSGEHAGIDCSHWCVAGLPDTWNTILYAALSWVKQRWHNEFRQTEVNQLSTYLKSLFYILFNCSLASK